MSIKKLIVITTEYDPLKNKIESICDNIAKKHGIEMELRYEDWNFLKKYGEEDELGGYSFPQVFVEHEDGRIEHVLTRIPINERGKPDKDKAIQIIEEKFLSG